MAGADWLAVEIAWDTRFEALRVPRGTTVRGVIERARLAERWPELDLSSQRVGIYSEPVTLETLVREGDRVEVYQPLVADPKELRRRRLGAQKD